MDEAREQSEFNGSQLKLMRIDEILRGLSMARHIGDVQTIFNYLRDFHMELLFAIKPDEAKELETELDTLQDMVYSYINKKNNKHIRYRPLGPSFILMNGLNKFQMHLMLIYKESSLEVKLQGTAMSKFGRRQ